jgi:molybdopterin-guanine dinucleotide biosynthesis protein A
VTADRILDPRILGAVVAGGRASRFGSDKALALWDGQPLLAHAVATIGPWVDAVAVVGREWHGLPAIADLPHPGLGPLGGIAGALAHARAGGFVGVLTIGCDMPLVPDELIERVLRRAPAYCADAPILGFWPASLADTLAERLAGDPVRSIRGWARDIGALPIAAGAPLHNVNTPADLRTDLAA